MGFLTFVFKTYDKMELFFISVVEYPISPSDLN